MQINGLYNGYHSEAAYREAAMWGETPEIQNKAQKTAESAMTDSFVKQIKEWAKKDAQKGDYMSDEFGKMRLAHMNKHVSPDRSKPMAQVSQLIQDAMDNYDPLLSLLDTMLGEYSVEARVSPTSQSAKIFSSDGEMIASYSSLNGGWRTRQTAAEKKFLSEAASIYAQAFKEARTEMKEAAQSQIPQGESSNINIRV